MTRVKIATTLAYNSIVFVGLDCETTGRDIEAGSRLFNAALAIDNRDIIVMREVNLRPEAFSWDSESELIHKVKRDEVEGYGTPATAESDLLLFLSNLGLGSENQFIAVGFNVGSFDLPYFRVAFPELMKRFNHRVVDLNSLIYLLAESLKIDFDTLKHEYKMMAGRTISAMLPTASAHQAGYDAIEAILIFNMIRDKIRLSNLAHS